MKRVLYFSTSIVIFFALFMPNVVEAQVNIGFGPRGGVSFFETPIESRPVFGAHFKMGYSPRLDFELFGEYTSSSFEEIIAQNAFDTSWKELKLGFSATHTLLPSSSFVHPYVGGGFCMHRFTRKYSGEGGQSVPGDKSESAGCFHAIGGIKLKPAVMPFEFFVEGRYMFIGAEEEPTNFFSLVAGFSIFVLRK